MFEMKSFFEIFIIETEGDEFNSIFLFKNEKIIFNLVNYVNNNIKTLSYRIFIETLSFL